ncbi:MAG: UMP kinase [Thermoproteus sp.]|jgi:uridylate kinase|nr:UMP kinase [Thermoproteus sp.]MDT7881353.1 UMP kinase [Thermoproteus sp.]
MIAVKLSGRIFDDRSLVREYVSIIKSVEEKVVVIAGGGTTARSYIEAARELGAGNYLLDVIGIEASRLNAWLIIAGLGEDVYPKPAESLGELLTALGHKRRVVMGGLQPGQSTATVAALAAEAVGARALINCANIDGIYDDDPRRNPNAKRIPTIRASELAAILRSSALPGTYELADIWSLEILRRSKIPMYIIDGRRPGLLLDVLRGGVAPGSLVLPE